MNAVIYTIGVAVCTCSGLLLTAWLSIYSAKRMWRSLIHLHDTVVLVQCIQQLRSQGRLWTPVHRDSPFTDE